MEEFVQNKMQDKSEEVQIKTVYCFGDNPLSDIYGANLFTEQLQKVKIILQATFGWTNPTIKAKAAGNQNLTSVASLEKCVSVLVGTGVYDPDEPEPESVEVDHGHRDLPFKAQLCKANVITDNVLTAMHKVFEMEGLDANAQTKK